MKLANVRGRATILSADNTGIDVANTSQDKFGPDLLSVYDSWSAFTSFAESFDATATATTTFDPADLRSPSPTPRQVFGIGLNYRAHAEETGAAIPTIPVVFTKFPACLAGPFDDVRLPADTVDWEVELVVVLGSRADAVSEGDAWTRVAGLTVGQDISERTLQRAAGGQFCLGKSHRGFGPMGPWLVTPDELTDPDDLALGCSLDGETMQDARTSDLIFTVPQLIAEISAVVPLLPGDVIFTGTPSGVGAARKPPRYLRAGELLESWIEGIGTIRNRIVA